MLKLVKGQSRITKFSLNHVLILNLSRRNTSMWAGGEWGWCWCTTTTTSTSTTTTTSSTSTATSTTIHSGKWGRARTRHWSCFGKLLVLALQTSTLGQQLCIFDNQLRSAPVQEHSYMNMHKKYFFVIWPNTPGQAGALLWSSEAAGWSSRANWSVIRSQAILHHILMRGSKAQRKAHPDQRLIFNQHEKWKEKETNKGLGCTWWISDRLTILLANAKSF